MSEEIGDGTVPPFDDPRYDDLRALLADARATDPVPADVAARLDETLAGLRAEEAPGPVVVPLGSRRRAGARLLLAAAVAGGVLVGSVALIQRQTGGSDELTPRTASDTSGGRLDAGGDTGSSGTGSSADQEKASPPSRASVPRVRSATFATDAARLLTHPPQQLLDLRSALRDADTPSPTSPEPPRASTPTDSLSGGLPESYGSAIPPAAAVAQAAACTPPTQSSAQDATVYPILLDGRPATLLVHPPAARQRLIQAWSCDGSRVLATATVPA